MKEKQFEFEANTGKILDIVINSLYSQKEIFLRELISNASDAINRRNYEVLSGGASSETFDGEIVIRADKKTGTLTITDNGIGMTADEMKNTLGTIASSGTRAFMESSTPKKKQGKSAGKSDGKSGTAKNKGDDVGATLIGQFGVGFYSAFMVAERIEVLSRKHASGEASLWSSDGKSGFQIAGGARQDTGTDVVIHLRDDTREFVERERIGFLVKKYSDHIAHPINWIKVDGDDDGEADQLNSSTALWTRPAREVGKEEYEQFYQSMASAYDKPFATLHNRTEGAVEFTNLVFVPASAPFDIQDPERRTKLQLYVNRVFITDNCEGLVPKWLRFLRGIIDTPDVDLNVSREMLQQNPVVAKINKAVVRRVLDEFAKAIDKRRDEYDRFWDQLGRVVKEGLYEDASNKDRILDVCLFKSALHDKYVTLREYVDAFATGQKQIYYLSAENAEFAMGSPHLESFRSKGIDVLVFTDPIDDFWISGTENFDSKPFQSITRGEIDIQDVGKAKKDDEKSEVVLSDAFVARMKMVLGGQVADVRSSPNLETSLARLVANAEGMDPQMERMMRLHNPDFAGGPKILEVNAKHHLVKALDARIAGGDLEGADNFARLIYDSAIVAEGESIADPRDFAGRIASLMELALGGKAGAKAGGGKARSGKATGKGGQQAASKAKTKARAKSAKTSKPATANKTTKKAMKNAGKKKK